MQIYRVLPHLCKERHLALWHNGIRSQWLPSEMDWEGRTGRLSPSRRDQLARVLTPLLMGEQAALYSITRIIQILGTESEVESQLYLTSMLMDEARHTELFSRFYARLERDPLSIRRLPNSYLFQSVIMSEDPCDWMVGSLVSEMTAKLCLEGFRRQDLDPVLTEMVDRILDDEARHLGFNRVFLEDRAYQSLAAKERPDEDLGEQMRRRLAGVLESVPPMFDSLSKDMLAVGLDPGEIYEETCAETAKHLEKAIQGAQDRAAKEASSSGL